MLTVERTARARPVARPRLVAPWADAWLVGGLGVVAWVMLVGPPGPLSFVAVPEIGGVLLWVLLAVTGTHFGISYHLAYGQGRAEVLRRWPALVGTPIVLAAAAAVVVVAALTGRQGLAEGAIRVLLVAVFTLTGWHYVKQVYGVTRLFGALHGLRITDRDAKVLRYGLYPLWFLNASIVWTQGYRPASYGYAGGFEVLPPVTEWVLMAAAVASFLVVAVCFVRLGLRWRRVPPAAMWTPYLAGFLFFVWTPGHISTFLVLGALHGAQYLVCAHRAEVAWGAERAPGRPVAWWASVFGGALAGGMLLSYWLPMWLGDATATTGLGPIVAVLLFSWFNLHHYAVDSAIWRSRDGHVKRIMAAGSAN